MGKQNLEGVKSIQWGITKEKEAIVNFEKTQGLAVDKTGLWLNSSGCLGASPDGLVGEECLIEVKCPYKHRNSTGQEILEDPNYCFEINDGEITIKATHPYYHQLQGQLHIGNRKWA